MKTIYVDCDFKCHITNDGTMTAVETDFFDGKCTEFIEGHRLIRERVILEGEVPVESYTEMITPWKDYDILEAYQQQYEVMQAELAAAYQEGVNSV